MAARRLVLNGLTAEVGAEAGTAGGEVEGSPDSLEFYHELELYRQLLALPPPGERRARTPDPTPTRSPEATPPRRSRTPCARVSASTSALASASASVPTLATAPRPATPAPATGHTRPAQVVFNNTQRVCHRCWQRLGNEVERPAIPEEQQNAQELFVQDYMRAPNTPRHCIFNNCQNATRLRIPDTIKVHIFCEHRLYIPDGARVCGYHLESNDWEELPQLCNVTHNFNAQQFAEVCDMMRTAVQRGPRLDFRVRGALSDAEMNFWVGLSCDEFDAILEQTPSQENCKTPRMALGIYLTKLRTGDSDERLATLFNISRRKLERLLGVVRECLLEEYVTQHLGVDHITRNNALERNLTIPRALFGNEDNNKLILIADGTYIYINKSSNFLFQRQSYSLHKFQNLLKPFVIVCSDGYIIDVLGPYAATKTDANIMTDIMSDGENPMHYFLHENDVFILDRGFRDSLGEIEASGYECYMPPTKDRQDTQLTTEQANESRSYLGSFPVCGGERALSEQLLHMKDNDCAVPVLVLVAPSGVKICDPEDQSVRMYHALRRISFATCERSSALFAFVAREPRAEPVAEPLDEPAPRHYCHAFRTDTPVQAEELNSLVGDAFRMAFASQLQPSAPLWSAELSGGECARAPDSLPGLTHHYPRPRDRSPSKCNIMGMQHEASPTSSEESNSPTEINCYRRLGERAPLMKRLAMGLSGALLQPSDDDSTPLVADTPTTPTNLPLCMNGYVNEASEAEARSRDTRESNRELTPRHDSLHNDLDEFAKCNNIKNGSGSAGCSAATSSSSGASSCGGSHGSGNNNVPRAEPELRHAPWFQAGIPREIALEVLSNQPVGAFMVRCSTTQTGCFALSVRVPRDFQPSGIAHYLILRTPKGYKIKGFTKEFTSLSALVTHHSVMPELLPCPLRLARRAPPPRAPRDLDEPRHTPRHLPFRPQLDV